jgi:hypothetical protein
MADYSKRDFNFDLLGLAFGAQRFNNSPDGDTGASFPKSDAEDMARGARFIPGNVTMARRRGEKVTFYDYCSPCCWYWEYQDGSRDYHWERCAYEQIGKDNGKVKDEEGKFPEGVGACPRCGNINTNGGHVKSVPSPALP